jgi:hypothetical protein
MIAVILVMLGFLFPSFITAQDTYTPRACTHYASATGSGSTCTYTSPCLINSFWSISSLPGKTLCLFDGTYTGANSMIAPPSGLTGTVSNPITVRALNDGGVLINAQNARRAININWHGGGANSNNWFVVEGVNIQNGLDGLATISADNVIGRRVVAWNGTSGQADSNIFRVDGLNSRWEDCAGWGLNSRKIFDGAQGGNLQTSGFRRCWGEWNEHPLGGSTPSNTYQMGYNSSNQFYENVIGTWDSLGDNAEPQGGLNLFCNNEGTCSVAGSQLLGSIFYVFSGSSYPLSQLIRAGGITDVFFKDVVGFVASGYTSVQPFILETSSSNTCDNCLSIHAGATSTRAAWTTPNWREGNGLAAATGGTSAFTLLPGICRRYENGTLTTTPLWPWPMNKRIKDARSSLGYRTTDVNAEIASILGTIPSACIATSDRANVGGRTVSGEIVMGPLEVWPTRQGVRASIEAAGQTNGGIVLALTVEASYDGGSNWVFVSSVKRPGGAVLDDAGNPQPNLYLATKLKAQSGGTLRLVRAKVNMPSSSYVSNGGFIEATN